MTTTTPATFRLARPLPWAATALAAFLSAGPAAAQQPPHDGREPPSPPPEAYTACKDQTEGASVTLAMPDGRKLQGTCRTMNGTLVAMPAGGPPGAGGPPPAR
ncbi:hypothetical protein [Acidovorax sacchari]|uniref:hypothetical protein n=1 Tax=Acidovorax sacchari TaxID=3230736 RepID=UPI0039E3AB08